MAGRDWKDRKEKTQTLRGGELCERSHPRNDLASTRSGQYVAPENQFPCAFLCLRGACERGWFQHVMIFSMHFEDRQTAKRSNDVK